RFVEHLTRGDHPERPDRIRAIHRAVREAGMIASPDPFPDFQINFGRIDGQVAQLCELEPVPADEKWLLEVHTPHHVNYVKRICEAGGGVLDMGDTAVGASSYEIALLAIGAVLRCCSAVM